MDRLQFLRWYLWLGGLLNIFVISLAVPLLLGDLLLWHPRNIPDERMISVIYLSMGVLMIAVARRPLAHKSYVDFLVLSNVLHAAVMLLYARNVYHVVVDVAGIGALGLAPLFFYPWGLRKFLRYA